MSNDYTTIQGLDSLSLGNEGFRLDGIFYSYADVVNVNFTATVTKHSINGIPTGPTYESKLFLTLRSKKRLQIRQESSWMRLSQKAHFEAVCKAGEILSEITFSSRLATYENHIQQKGFMDIGEFQIGRNGDLFRNHELLLNIKEAGVFAHLGTFSLHIKPKIAQNGFWKRFVSSLTARDILIPINVDRDCILWILKNYCGLSWSDVKLREKKQDKKKAFYEGLLRLGGKLCKIDGQISASEILVFKKYFGIDDNSYPGAGRIFMEAASSDIDEQVMARELRDVFEGAHEPLEYIVLGLMRIAAADGFEDAETDFIKNVCRGFGFKENEIAKVFALFDLAYASTGSGGFASGNTAFSQRSRFLQVLGIYHAATEAEIKAAYKNLVRKHHPDILQGQGVPINHIRGSEEILKRINEAYDWLCRQPQTTA